MPTFDPLGINDSEEPSDPVPCPDGPQSQADCEADYGPDYTFERIELPDGSVDCVCLPPADTGGRGDIGIILPPAGFVPVTGCMDPDALNYDETATIDCEDCCIYPVGFESSDEPGTDSPQSVPYVDASPSVCSDVFATLPVAEQAAQTCFPNPNALVPDWLKMRNGESFLNQRTCEYSVVMLADPPDCSQEYLNSFISDGIDVMLNYYGKESTDTLYSLATVKAFYVSPKPLEKTRVLIVVGAEEFNKIPAMPEEPIRSTLVLRGLEPSYVVFHTDEIRDIFDRVSSNMRFFETSYADWSHETGKYIKGLNLSADAKRIEEFYKELSLFLGEDELSYDKLETVEVGFTGEYKISYVKVKERYKVPRLQQKGLDAFLAKPINQNFTTMAYISRLPDISEDLSSRGSLSWYDLLQKYRNPVPQEVFANDLTSPFVEGNEGLKALADSSCSASTVFQPKQGIGDWHLSQVKSIGDALLEQLKAEPCILVDGKILEHRNKESLAMQMVDLTLKEYIVSDRVINDLPTLIANGKWDNIKDLYDGMIANLWPCGFIGLVQSAVDCFLNQLGYEDSMKIIMGSAIKAMDSKEFSRVVNSLPVYAQESLVAIVGETAPQALPFLQSMVSITIEDDDGVRIEAVYDRAQAYSYTSAGRWSRLEPLDSGGENSIFSDVAGNVNYPPPSAEDYDTLNEVFVSMIRDDILAIDDILAVLDTLPGAPIIVSTIEKMDKFCAVPPRFYPPLNQLISFPGINIDPCKAQGPILPLNHQWFKPPKTTLPALGNLAVDKAKLIFEQLGVRLLILILKKLLETISDELCKQRVNTDPTGLRELMMAGCSGDMDPSVIDQALSDIAGAIGCFEDPVALGRFIDNISSVLTECELVDIVSGEASDSVYDLVYQVVQADPITEPLAECLNDKESISDFFRSIGVFIDLDRLCILAPLDLPFSQEVCDDLGLLALFRDTRMQALRDKGVDEECINDQLCRLRDRTLENLEELTDMLHSGVFDNILPSVVADPANPGEMSILPAIDPAALIGFETAFDSMYESLTVQYTDDLIGRRGLLNMSLADSRGRGLAEHMSLQRSILGPSVFNIYGSRGTRAYPPWDEWGAGSNSPASHNSWISDPIPYSDDKRFWKLPFLFNPLAAIGEPDQSVDIDSGEGSDLPTTGQPPAVGGLPDKVAGHLQTQLSVLNPGFNKDNKYSSIIHWEEYGEDRSEFDIDIYYDYHIAGSPYDENKYSVKVDTTIDLPGVGRKSDSSVELSTQDIIPDDVLDFIQNQVASQSDNIESTPADIWGSFVEGIVRQISIDPSLVSATSLYETFRTRVFNRVNAGFLEKLSDDISKVDIFNYGFDSETPPTVVYFHEDSEGEFEGNLAAAIERYGGSEANPPFYLKQPSETGYLRLANSIVPEFNPCEERPTSVKFPNFSELKQGATGMISLIKDDERLAECEGSITNVVEAPFDRALPSVSIALNDSLVYATIRIYLSEFMLKGIPAFYFLKPEYPNNYTDMISEYIVTVMLDELTEVGRGIRTPQFNRDYYYLFLEQAVQTFNTKLQYNIITDATPEELEALREIYSFVETNWAGHIPPTRTVSLDREIIDETIRQKMQNWRNILSEPLVQEHCKTILRRYVGEELDKLGFLINESLPANPPYPIENIDDLIIKSPGRKPEAVEILAAPGGPTGEGYVRGIDVPYFAGAVNEESDGGPIDVPTLGYYSFFDSSSTASEALHPLDEMTPTIDEREWPFVLERYVTYRGSSVLHPYGRVANLFDWGSLDDASKAIEEGKLYFGLRLSYVPTIAERTELDFTNSISPNIAESTSFSEKAYAEAFKNLIPLVSVETLVVDSQYQASNYGNYLQDLICKLIATPEYRMMFKYAFPLARYMSFLAIYTSKAFVPSIGRISDGWAATVSKKSGGGQWIGFGKLGGMRTWRGNEGMKKSFRKSKTVARQLLEASCNTNYFYQDRDELTPTEAFVELNRTKNDSGLDIKWWQWSSLRPAPCKEGE